MSLFADFMTNSVFYTMIAIGGWVIIFKSLNRNAPNVMGAAKKAAANKALNVIANLFK